MATTRRDFIQAIGKAGGFSAAYLAMQGMGLLPNYANAQPLKLQPGSGKGVKIVILGAGIAGLASADELLKAGYDVTILEARDRVGGHNWTVRNGDKVEWTDGSVQTASYDADQYFNTGPARLPSHHQAVLGYCRELGIELEVEVNVSRSAYLRNANANGGKPVQFRQAINDTRGHVSELLAKAIGKGALDQDFSAADKERMLGFLRQYGDLNPDMFYKGSKRSGYKPGMLPGAADAVGVAKDPLDMSTLLDIDMWNNVIFEDSIDDQATMFQPVGGMDAIPKALARKIGLAVFKLSSEVKEIRRIGGPNGKGARIVYLDKKTGQTQEVLADYVICTIPLPVLAKIPADFSDAIAKNIGDVYYGNAVKIGFESRRFWEQDYQVYGGISFTKDPGATIWHPSGGYHKPKGITVYYIYMGGEAVTMKPQAQQHVFAAREIDAIFPGSGRELGKPIVINWGKIPYNEGNKANLTEGDPIYATMNKADGPFYFANDWLSHAGWQEGAIQSARYTVAAIDKRVHAGKV
ncbi:FAD-dependent oxidoreductase [soil metagenome]